MRFFRNGFTESRQPVDFQIFHLVSTHAEKEREGREKKRVNCVNVWGKSRFLYKYWFGMAETNEVTNIVAILSAI